MATGFEGLSVDSDPANAWSCKCFAYSRSQVVLHAPVTSGSFTCLEYGLYSKVYCRSFADPPPQTSIGDQLVTLLREVGSRGLNSLTPCSTPTSIFDLVPQCGILAFNSIHNGGNSIESTIDCLVRDLKHANSLVPPDQQCTIKSTKVTINIRTLKYFRPSIKPDSSLPAGEVGDADSDSDDAHDSDEEEGDYDSVDNDEYGNYIDPTDVLTTCHRLYSDKNRFIAFALGKCRCLT